MRTRLAFAKTVTYNMVSLLFQVHNKYGECSIRVYRSLLIFFNQTLPIMLALCLMLLGTYYAQNYAGIIGRSLATRDYIIPLVLHTVFTRQLTVCSVYVMFYRS